MAWWKAVSWGIGGAIATTVAGGISVAIVEHSKVRRAVHRFNLRFPEGSERRSWALAFLSDFTPSNDGSTKFLDELIPLSMRANLSNANSGFTEEETPERELEPSVPQHRRRASRREAIRVDLSKDPDALIPLELPSDVRRKKRG